MKKNIIAVLCLSLGLASSARAFNANNFCQVATAATVLGAAAGGFALSYIRDKKLVDPTRKVFGVPAKYIYGDVVGDPDDQNMEKSDCIILGALNGAGLGFALGCGGMALAASLYYAGAAANSALNCLY